MTLVFRSDSSIAREGFSANYVALDGSQVCGGVYHSTIGSKYLLTELYSTVCLHFCFLGIRSPDWPNNYGHDRECSWKIQVPVGQQIMLNFTVFDLENHTNCNYDFLEIR